MFCSRLMFGPMSVMAAQCEVKLPVLLLFIMLRGCASAGYVKVSVIACMKTVIP